MTSYRETRRHELRRTRVTMIDGNLALNSRGVESGISTRVYDGGYWGFASASDTASADAVSDKAQRNARQMARFGARATHSLPGGHASGEHVFHGKTPLSQKEIVDRLGELHAFCGQRYPGLVSTRFMLSDEHHSKWLDTGAGAGLNSIQRAQFYAVFTADGDDGAPVELWHRLSAKGSLADLDWSLAALEPQLDELHRHLQAKRHAVPARGGAHTVVMGPMLAGILAHEAMGHPCEADIVLGGAVTADLLGQQVASERVTMIDYAHSRDGVELMMPVYADDEGVPASDAVLIRNGVLSGFMHSRETAARMGVQPTGSARAYAPHDEPLVRMRNTAIEPGSDKLDAMIAGVDDGYLLLDTGNGQADSTSEFMFAITLGYEIKDGRIGRAIRDTTVSGSAIKVLQSVDAVSDDMHWTSAGYCGKKQSMVVSMGGPALRARAHLGGQ